MNRNAAKDSFLERVQKILDRTGCWRPLPGVPSALLVRFLGVRRELLQLLIGGVAVLHLLLEHPVRRLDLRRIDCLACQALRVEPGQRSRARKAPGMRGEDAISASVHRLVAPTVDFCH